ncbi:peptidylprolyl isomerase [Acidipropionibacterium virtanenii]|uniref:Putative peptidyl-prolyl cis-trans isomerase B n=1 Tax=Acidipropionibacterium virtanenii TaxID=2057246 RepID=A0A344UTW4_9ACTN|nr:peptidylprolyl isomerase [Acidipropionibacterium virtanenii]AXE38712.1 putative peptidyl-prolyl cis-trans isomerase B [Acidipropionibacterium virtanenii]
MARVHAPVVVTVAALLAVAGCAREPGTAATQVSPARTTSCSYPAEGTPARAADPPQAADISAAGTATVTMSLDSSTIVLRLDRSGAPCAVNSFIHLAEQGYFNGTRCHRLSVTTAFYLECGDPTGTGTGGPGYRFAAELDGDATYPAGTVAMATSQGRNGSQFFIVTEDSDMPPRYTVIGTVDQAGLTAVRTVADKGAGADGRPRDRAELGSATMG